MKRGTKRKRRRRSEFMRAFRDRSPNRTAWKKGRCSDRSKMVPKDILLSKTPRSTWKLLTKQNALALKKI